MKLKPFLKWAGGKRWLTEHPNFQIPDFSGKYIEPFLGGGAVFFDLRPNKAILSDLNPKLINAYICIRDQPKTIKNLLKIYQHKHSREFYYEERARKRRLPHTQAAQFIYLNRTCWNGLYRENLNGDFNVPIGSKNRVLFEFDDFDATGLALEGADIRCSDFEETINEAESGDLVFIDPPYTTAHNLNGFIKYNQKIFNWDDQIRLKISIERALHRGAQIILTNANHESIHALYRDIGKETKLNRYSVIAGSINHRKSTSESLFHFQP